MGAAGQPEHSVAFKNYVAALKAAVLKPASVKLDLLPNEHLAVMEVGEELLADRGHEA
jgi:hypothetical protein